MKLSCPRCGRADTLDVKVETWARLSVSADESDNLEADVTEAGNQDLEFDETALVMCVSCQKVAMLHEVAQGLANHEQ